MRRGNVYGKALAMAGTLWFATAGAGEASPASDRARLMKAIDTQLEELERYTEAAGGADENRSKQALKDGALRITRLKASLRDLHRVKEADPDANERARQWPRILLSFEQAYKRFGRMKGLQYAFDDLRKGCERREEELEEALENYFDPVKITRLAQQAGRPVKASLARSGQVLRELQRDLGAVRRFSGRGPWRRLQDVLRESAAEAVQYADRVYEDAEEACEDLALQEKHPKVLETLGEIRDLDENRLQLMADTDAILADMAEILEGGFELDDDSSRLKDALRLAGSRLTPKLSRLAKIAEGDEDAEERVRAWPNAIDAFEEAMKDLDVMKKNQFGVDGLAEECKEAEGKLHFEILGYLGRNKRPEGILELPRRGFDLGKEFGDKIRKASALLAALDRKGDEVLRFEGEEGWEEVEEVVHSLADLVYVHVEEYLERAEAACKNLLLGQMHPRIVKAKKELEAYSDRGLNLFNAEAGKWITASRKLFGLNCDALEALWEDYCAMDGEPNEEEERERMLAADRAWLAAEIDEKIEASLDEFKKLEARYDYLSDPAQPAQIRSGARTIFDRAQRRKARLEAILKQAEDLEGNQDPLKQFATRYGIERHKAMTSKWKCDVADKRYRRGRPDCVVAKTCMVLEFKPDNPDQVAKGFEQLRSDPGYVDQIEDYYSGFLPVGGTPRKVPSASLGGEKIMVDLDDAGCIRGDRVHFGHDVKTYKVCTMPFTCKRSP